MPDAQTTTEVIETAETIAEGMLPILLPFDPAIKLLTTVAVRAFFAGAGRWPTVAEVKTLLPADYQSFKAVWAQWKGSGDGTQKS